ncbi:MAG: FAD-binding protein [Ruminococcus sp.]|nr:FAD-binding protein [Ruminococcus sp.]
MKILKNENLSKYTTVRIGGTAETFCIPESREELVTLIAEQKPEFFIGGGSNLLIAERSFPLVVSLRQFDKELSFLGEGHFRAGASVRLQKLIDFINQNGCGGIEYLYSVPGLVGGAVVMNAGRGRKFKKCISDYLLSVTVLKIPENCIVHMTKEECGFSYRNSVFKNNSDMLVLEAEFQFPVQSEAESLRLKNERLTLCRNVQDNSKANFGTVFCSADSRIMKLVQKTGLHSGNVSFSKKTSNWILSDKGSFEDAVKVISKVQKLHRIAGKKAVPEVIIWK